MEKQRGRRNEGRRRNERGERGEMGGWRKKGGERTCKEEMHRKKDVKEHATEIHTYTEMSMV